jgi:uncharacterized protein YdcH (DUF465 family)
MEKDEFSKIFGNDDEIDDTISSLENDFQNFTEMPSIVAK